MDYEVFVSTRGKRLSFYLELIPFITFFGHILTREQRRATE